MIFYKNNETCFCFKHILLTLSSRILRLLNPIFCACRCCLLLHRPLQDPPPASESEASFNSDDEALEEQIMEQLAREAEAEAEADRLHELTLNEEDLARQVSKLAHGFTLELPDVMN